MPDKNPDAGPAQGHDGHTPHQGPLSHESSREAMLAHTMPPGLKKRGVIAVCVLGAVAVLGIGWRVYRSHETSSWTQDQLVPTVSVIRLETAGGGASLRLPGQLQAFTNAPIYAQVSGYVQRWFVDIGTPVKQGQLLAQIDPRT